MATPTQTRKILIKVDAPGVKDALDTISRSMGTLNKNTKGLSGNMSFLTNAFRGWLGYIGVREITRMSDEMQNLYNRLKITSGGVEGANVALQGLYDIANRTNQSLSGTGEIYTRLALSLQGAKATSGELQSLTESLINTFRVAGATTTETTNTIIQLSQAFSSGELRGQELRSVMEQNATLATLLRERFGQDIYKKAADGAIRVTDVLQVLAANQEKINAQAKELAPTFEQTLTKSMNSVALAIGKLNNQYELSSKFAAVMGFAVNNLGDILITLGTIAVGLAITQVPALITAIQALGAAMLSLATKNPILLAITAITLALGQLYIHWEKVTWAAKEFKAALYDVAAAIESKMGTFRAGLMSMFGGDPTKMIEQNKKMVEGLKERAEYIRMYNSGAQEGPQAESPEEKMKRDMDSLIKKIEIMSKPSGKLPKIKEILGEINKEYLDGAISINQYNAKLIDFELYKVNREFREGKMDVFAFNEKLRDLRLAEFNRQLAEGVITLQRFKELTNGENLMVLDEQFKAGKISLNEYNQELVKLDDRFRASSSFAVGVNSYIESVGTLSSGIAKGIDQAFGHLEDNFFEFTKTGQFNFSKFAQSVLDDLMKIIIRSQIIAPLAQGMLNFAGGSANSGSIPQANYAGNSYAMPNAKGNAFSGGNLIPFAKGGIVDSPTAFSFGGGKKGVMGEAGTEAILPLARGSNGDLGVQASITPVTVNIINQSGAEVEQRERTGPNGEKAIDIIIANKVREGISTGKFDSAFKNSYGLTRKGS